MPAIAQNSIKLNASVLLAALITFLLFYFMQFLIKSESDTPQTINAVRILDSTVPDSPPYLVIEEERPEPIEKEKIRLVSKPTRNTDFPTGPIIRLVPEKPPLDASKEGLLPMTNNIMTQHRTTRAEHYNEGWKGSWSSHSLWEGSAASSTL